tara:strand:- start:900 stop:1082 length:183 start_codon:yes stop_codon:yes gene_type:complete
MKDKHKIENTLTKLSGELLMVETKIEIITKDLKKLLTMKQQILKKIEEGQQMNFGKDFEI